MNIEILAFIIIPIIAWGLIVHTLLYRDRNRVYEAWSELHELLEKRINLVKQIVKESNNETLQKLISDIDNRVYLPKLAMQHNNLVKEINESELPEKTTQSLSDLNKEIEQHIQWYNATSKNLNIRLDSFPDMLIAKVFGFRNVEYFAPKDPEKTQDSPLF